SQAWSAVGRCGECAEQIIIDQSIVSFRFCTNGQSRMQIFKYRQKHIGHRLECHLESFYKHRTKIFKQAKAISKIAPFINQASGPIDILIWWPLAKRLTGPVEHTIYHRWAMNMTRFARCISPNMTHGNRYTRAKIESSQVQAHMLIRK